MQHQLSADDGFQSLQTDAVILNSSSGSHTETLFFFLWGGEKDVEEWDLLHHAPPSAPHTV